MCHKDDEINSASPQGDHACCRPSARLIVGFCVACLLVLSIGLPTVDARERRAISATPAQLANLMGRFDLNGDAALNETEFEEFYESFLPSDTFDLSGDAPMGPPYDNISCVNATLAFAMFDPTGRGNVNETELGDAAGFVMLLALDCLADPCGLQSNANQFDLALHVSSIFIILVVSTIGSAVPLIMHRRGGRCTPKAIVFVWLKHFGTGVLVALGFVHLLTPAFENLAHECLPAIFEEYAFAPSVCLFSALLMHLIESLVMYGARKWRKKDREHGHSHAHGLASKSDKPGDASKAEELEDDHDHDHDDEHHGHSHGILLGDPMKTIPAYLLELGLATHSVIIGLAIGTASLTQLYTLLPALAFHQFFEGFALGANIAEADIPTMTQAVLISIYSLSAPVGMAVGVGLFSSVNSDLVTTAIVQGTADAISAGIILYVGLVQMLGHDFPSDLKKHAPTKLRRFLLFSALWLGAFAMALIGGWV